MPQILRTIGKFCDSLCLTIWLELEHVEPVMVMDSQRKLMNLAPGHPPLCKSHPHGCRCLMSHFHAPICTKKDVRNLPVRKFAAANTNLPPLRAPRGHGLKDRAHKPCPWTSPKK